MLEIAFAVVAAVNILAVVTLLVFLFKWFPRIAHSVVYVKAIERKLAQAPPAFVEADAVETVAGDAERRSILDDKPLGVDAELWERAVMMAQQEGRPIEDCLADLQDLDLAAEAGFSPIGLERD